MHLTLTDPDLLAELARYGDRDDQERIALVALRLGLQALRLARGEVDALALQQTAERVLDQIEGRFSQHLAQHSAQLAQQFSLDQPDSLLQRLVQTTEGYYRQVADEGGARHTELIARLEALATRRQLLRQSTQGGTPFEEAVVTLISTLAHGAGDRCERVADQAGSVSRAKVGDAVITLGADCAAAGERIVVEAKRSQSYSRGRALEECKAARENRDAQAAIFVWDRASARAQPPLSREGRDIIVLWDEEDPASDVYVHAAYWLARGLVTPKPATDHLARAQQRQVEGAFEHILGLSAILEKIKKSGEEVVKKGQEVVTLSLTVQGQLEAQVAALRALTTAPRAEEPSLPAAPAAAAPSPE